MPQSDNCEAAVLLRPMQAADVTFLTGLWVASWAETLPAIDFAGRAAWLAGYLREAGHPTEVAVDLDGEAEPVGFATWETRPERPTYLHQLVVAPRAKGRGVARRLLHAVQAQAPAGLELDVNADNARAVRFYVREGFAPGALGTNPLSALPTWSMRWAPADAAEMERPPPPQPDGQAAT